MKEPGFRQGVNTPELYEKLIELSGNEDDVLHTLRMNYDPISEATYTRIFERNIKKDGAVVNIGAGAVLDISDSLNHLNSTLLKVTKTKGFILLM